MFSRLTTAFLYALVAFTVLAVATPNPYLRRGDKPTTAPPVTKTTSSVTKTTPSATKTITVTAPAPSATNAGQCSTGSLQCCDSVQSADSASASALLGLLGIILSDPTALVGLTCSPLSVIGVGSGSACNTSPVCCTNNSFGGLISVGCIPVNI